MIVQLLMPIPMVCTSKGNATGLALFILDYGMESDIIYGIAIDDTCEIWWVPNSEVRIQKNWTMGRR